MHKIREMRLTKKVDMKEFSFRLNIPKRTLYKIEEHRSKVSMKHALKIARFFKTDIADLFTPDELLCSAAFKKTLEEEQ